MVYRAIGLMSGSSLDGLDIVFAGFQENAGMWTYEILKGETYPYDGLWTERLRNATFLSAKEYQLLHTEYGHFTGKLVNRFIEENNLAYQVALVASHGHTSFHIPSKRMTAQLGDGAAIAAVTKLPVVSDLRSMDIALGGQGAPIVPIGEKFLLGEYDYFLNIGGITNVSVSGEPPSGGWGFDICPANRVLNLLANEAGKNYDENGNIAAGGLVNESLLEKLNQLDYYQLPFPKSLANDFGTDVVYPIIKQSGTSIPDGLRTYTEHIAIQLKNAIRSLENSELQTPNPKLLVTGGGACNHFLMNRIRENLKNFKFEVIIPDTKLIHYKEALIMAFIGVLRWRQENNVLSSVTGAARNSIGGALWTGEEA